MGQDVQPFLNVSRTAADLVGQVLTLARRIRDRLDERCESEGVNASRFAILQALAASDADGCSQTDLAAALQLSESNVCSLIERMRTTGLLFRFRSKVDRRKSVLMLTEQGRELAESVSQARQREAEQLVASLNPEQRRTLSHILDQLSLQLDGLPPTESAEESKQAASTGWEFREGGSMAPERTSRRAS